MYILLLTLVFLTTTILLSYFLPKKWNLIKKVAVSFIVIYSINVLIGYILVLFKIPFYNYLIHSIYLLIIGLLFYKIIYVDRQKFTDLLSWQKKDTFLIFFSLVMFLILIIPSINLQQRKIELVTIPTEDNINHFFITNGIYEKGSYIYNDKSFNYKMPVGLQNYPQASHINLVLFLHKNSSLVDILNAYNLFILFNFIFLFTLLLNTVYDLFSKKLQKSQYYFLSGLILLILYNSDIFSGIYLHGFLSQIIAFSLLFVSISIVSSLSDFKRNWSWVLLVILISGAISATWFFLIPVYIAFCLLQIYRSSFKRNLAVYLAMVTISLPPIFFSVTSGSLNQINAGGGIVFLPYSIYGLLFIGSGIAFYHSTRLNKRLVTNFKLLILVAICFSILIGTYQLLSSGTFSYYFYKSLFTPIIIASVLLCVSGVVLLENILTRYNKANWLWVSFGGLIICILLSMTLLTNNMGFSLRLANRSSYLSFLAFRNVINTSYTGKSLNKKVLVINSGSIVSDYLFSKWIAALNLNHSQEFQEYLIENTLNSKKTPPPENVVIIDYANK